jgi:hypothetical protein
LLISLPGSSFKYLVLSDVLCVPGLMKALFSWSALKKSGRYYMEDKGEMFIRKFVNDEIVLLAREDPDTHLFNILIKM